LRRSRILLLGGALACGCARAFAPPGGERDVMAPRLESVSPAPLSVVPASRQAVVFRFDERISSRRFNRTLVTVNPAAPEDVNAEVSGHELRISLERGWQPGQVYQVLVRPGIGDLFGNERRDPVELIFSTGDPPPPSALAGLLEDRITGASPAEGVIQALRQGDSVSYIAGADSAGFFALRHVPYGTYDVTAYGDQNRNRRRDPSEAVAGPVVATLGSGQDTVMLALVLLPPDSTAPRLTGADRTDSVHVRLTFDDYLDADSMATFAAQVLALPDSAPLPHSVRVVADTATRRREARAAERTLLLEVDRGLPPADVAIRVSGVRNVNGLMGGGTAAVAYRPTPVAPAPSDSTAPTPDAATPADSTVLTPTDSVRAQPLPARPRKSRDIPPRS
jgi:hypothetical protein